MFIVQKEESTNCPQVYHPEISCVNIFVLSFMNNNIKNGVISYIWLSHFIKYFDHLSRQSCILLQYYFLWLFGINGACINYKHYT